MIMIDFSKIPYDVLQWVLNKFLTNIDRASLNTVLQWQERIYRRFSKGFAENHALHASLAAQNSIVSKMNHMAAHYELNRGTKRNYLRARKACKFVGLYADFLIKPMAKPLFQFRSKAKDSAISDLKVLISDEYIFDDYVSAALRKKVIKTIEILTTY
jgi:hypothetical protein